MLRCDGCHKQIESKHDVNVLAFFGLVPKTFCNDCYASRERGIVRSYVYYPRRVPINSKLFLILSIIGTIVLIGAIILLIFGSSSTPATVNGQTTVLSGGTKLAISGIILIFLIWNWILLFVARSRISGLQ